MREVDHVMMRASQRKRFVASLQELVFPQLHPEVGLHSLDRLILVGQEIDSLIGHLAFEIEHTP